MFLKMKLNVLIYICIGIVLFFLFYKYKSVVNPDVNHSPIPYNPKKINRNGEYQLYYGYTIFAMINTNLMEIAEQIERFIRASSFAKTYSPLPANTYHITIYSIYQCGSRMIPPVARWVNETGGKLSSHTWLPNKVLREQHDKAMCVLEKYLSEPLYIKYASLNIGERIIKLSLQAEEKSMERIRLAREELVKIYEDPDLSMEPISERLHLTLAYVYGPKEKLNLDEWNQLNELIRLFNGAKLLLPYVYLFDSMTHFIPYGRSEEVECELLI